MPRRSARLPHLADQAFDVGALGEAVGRAQRMHQFISREAGVKAEIETVVPPVASRPERGQSFEHVPGSKQMPSASRSCWCAWWRSPVADRGLAGPSAGCGSPAATISSKEYAAGGDRLKATKANRGLGPARGAPQATGRSRSRPVDRAWVRRATSIRWRCRDRGVDVPWRARGATPRGGSWMQCGPSLRGRSRGGRERQPVRPAPWSQ
jgi:hypothetical protein